jgi:hypothetical protein
MLAPEMISRMHTQFVTAHSRAASSDSFKQQSRTVSRDSDVFMAIKALLRTGCLCNHATLPHFSPRHYGYFTKRRYIMNNNTKHYFVPDVYVTMQLYQIFRHVGYGDKLVSITVDKGNR